jgi:LysM repeat protein
MHRQFRQQKMNQVKGMSAIGFLVALLMLSGCARQEASAGTNAARSAAPATAAATTAAAARPAATKAGPATGMTIMHTVQEGENLYRIGRKYGTSVQAIAQANGITDVTRITVGQKIAIPNIQATTEPEPTATPTLTPTPVPATATPIVVTATPRGPTPTIDPNVTPTATPLPPDNVNGIQLDQFVIMPPAVRENVKQIFATGQTLGNDPHRFSKVGDSIIEQPHYMVKFDTPDYNLGQYAYLQAVLNYYRGSYGRDSLSVRRGLHSWSWNNPTWADKDQCLPDEGPIACEYRVNNPSVSFIVLGSNDVGVPAYFRKSMEALVQFTIDQGVIPIIVTKADRHEGDSNINNTILTETAAKFNVPLLDFDAVAGTMPNRGVDPADGTHLTFYYAHDYSVPAAFTKGHAVHDLTSVIMLDRLWRLLGLKQ